jgi:hypothetical protein
MLQSCTNNAETRLIRIGDSNQEGEEPQLKIVNKQAFHVKERKVNMAIIKSMVTLEHPSIASLKYFFMSPNHYFFLKKGNQSGSSPQGVCEALLSIAH